jgi:hypothetical protein
VTNSATWWTVFGISGGLGLLINPSLIFFLIALGIALLLTEDRRLLFTRQAAWGISVFVIVASPICSEKSKTIGLHLNTSYNQSIQNMNISLSLLWFILNQIVVLGPITD